jgi:hypothetical protein
MDGQEDYLCESQISILVTGINSRVWTSYCLLDSYYKPKLTSRSPDEYDDAKAFLHGFRDNPLGTVDSLPCIPILDPGEYFLEALEGQVRMLLQEWNHTTETLYCRFRAHVSMLRITTSSYCPANQLIALQAGKQSFLSPVHDIEALGAFNILQSTQSVLDVLMPCLETTIQCWDQFEPANHSLTPACHHALDSIRRVFMELRQCLKEMREISRSLEECEKLVRTQQLHFTMINNFIDFITCTGTRFTTNRNKSS